MLKLPKRLIKHWTVHTWTVDKLDWTALPKDKDLLEETEVGSEVKVDSAVKEDSEVIETTQEIQATQLLSWAKMIRTPRREPSELLLERKLFSDDVLKTLSFYYFPLIITLNWTFYIICIFN